MPSMDLSPSYTGVGRHDIESSKFRLCDSHGILKVSPTPLKQVARASTPANRLSRLLALILADVGNDDVRPLGGVPSCYPAPDPGR